MNKFKRKAVPIALLIILVIATALRFRDAGERSLFHDEFSWMKYENYEGVQPIINKGLKNDVHPVGVPVFLYYWMKLTGNNVLTVRLPFLIFGILAIGMIFLLGALWFNRQTGLLASAVLTVSQFTVFYSQLARPYSMGLFFSLAAIYGWSLLLFSPKVEQKNAGFLIFTLAGIISCYTHYFSLFLTGLAGFTGFLFLNRNNYRRYLLSGVLIILAFLSHIHLLINHIQAGGLTWLPPPGRFFLFRFLMYTLNDSILMLSVTVISALILFWINRKKVTWSKYHSISLWFFFVPFLVAFVKSIYGKPVLQNSTLIFSFPFLPLFLYSFSPSGKQHKTVYIFPALILFTGIYSLAFQNRFYDRTHYNEYKELVRQNVSWDSKYGKENITRCYNVGNPYSIRYYLSKFNHKAQFRSYMLPGESDRAAFYNQVKNCRTPYLTYGWSNVNNPPGTHLIPLIYYKNLIDSTVYYDYSGIALYGKRSTATPSFHYINNFEDTGKMDSVSFTNEQAHSGTISLKTTPRHRFGNVFQSALTRLSCSSRALLVVTAWVYCTGIPGQSVLIAQSKSPHRKNYYQKIHIKNFTDRPHKWQKITMITRLPDIKCQDDNFKLYFWNLSESSIFIDDLQADVYSF